MNDKPVTTLEQKKDRRQALALGGTAAAAAAVAALFTRSNGAQAGHGRADARNALHLGEQNTAPSGSSTLVNADVNVGPGFGVGFGVGLQVENTGGGAAVVARAPGQAPALVAASIDPSDPNQCLPDGDGGSALLVYGGATFASAGGGAIPEGENSVFLPAGLTDNKCILVTLTSNPGPRQLQWVEYHPNGYTVHLTPAPPNKRPATNFTFFIVGIIAKGGC